MSGITTLHSGMILSTLSINSHCFTFGFTKRPRTNEDVLFNYKPMINLLISRCGTPPFNNPQQPPSNKVHHRASFEAYVALEQLPLN